VISSNQFSSTEGHVTYMLSAFATNEQGHTHYRIIWTDRESDKDKDNADKTDKQKYYSC